MSDSVIAELEDAIKRGSQDYRVETLRRVTDLFLVDADRFNESQIAVFDDVLVRLIARIETKAIMELSARLAPVDNAPIEVIRKLARDDEISVAAPILTQSPRLTTDDLVAIAGSKGQGHLLAISARRTLDEAVTDVLLDRGDREVRHTLAKNGGARFSTGGFTRLLNSAASDESLAEKVGLRLDLPLQLLRDLLLKATDAVRSRLLAIAPPETRDEIQRTLSKISIEVSQEVAAPRDFTRALQTVTAMRERGQLNEAAVSAFAAARKHEEVVVALALLCSAPIELIAPLMRSVRDDGLMIACKSAGLKWPTVQEILKGRLIQKGVGDPQFVLAKNDYLCLTQATAQRTMRFWKVRVGASSGSPGTAA